MPICLCLINGLEPLDKLLSVNTAGIHKVCFIGAGTMGCFNALMAAVAGYKAIIFDVSTEALDANPDVLSEMAGFLVAEGFFSRENIASALLNISTEGDLATAVADAELISESVSERLEIKRSVHQKLDQLCDANVIITTNTSSLLVSEIEQLVVNKTRFAAMHSHLGSTLIDIVGGSETSAENISRLKHYVLSIGAFPLLLKREYPGYVLNSIIGPLLTVSKMLVIEGVNTKENIDASWMVANNLTIGPFGLMDLFGLNVIFDSWQEPKAEVEHLQNKMVNFLSPYIEKNWLGVKTGAGFYRYPEPSYQAKDFLTSQGDLTFPGQVLMNVLIANAVLLAAEDVAHPFDIDRAWMVSMQVTKGPFGELDAIGFDTFLEQFDGFVALGMFDAQLSEKLRQFLQPYIDRNQLGEKVSDGFYQYPDPLYLTADFLTPS